MEAPGVPELNSNELNWDANPELKFMTIGLGVGIGGHCVVS